MPTSPVEIPSEVELLSAREIAKAVVTKGSTLDSASEEWLNVAALPAIEDSCRKRWEEELEGVWVRCLADPADFVERRVGAEGEAENLISWQFRALCAALKARREGESNA